MCQFFGDWSYFLRGNSFLRCYEGRLRRFLPDWQKNSQLLLLGNKDGKVSYRT